MLETLCFKGRNTLFHGLKHFVSWAETLCFKGKKILEHFVPCAADVLKHSEEQRKEQRKMCFSFVLLSTFRNFANKLANLLRLGKKKKRISFVLLSTFRNFALCKRELTPSRQKRNEFLLFCSRLFVTLPTSWRTYSVSAKKKETNFFCFALDFS